jgi:hypothetical protein
VLIVAGSTAEWELYERWNTAVANVVYTAEAAGVHVYLDLDDEVLTAIRDRAEPNALHAESAFVEAVKGTLVLGHGPADVLRGHLRRLDEWGRESSTEPPPTVALLGLLSLAAGSMREGEGMAANNFYGRLAEVLSVTEEELTRFTQAYRKRRNGEAVSNVLWNSLSEWLERLEGNRGLPTAFAFAHAHIGLPLSQALVRQTDRDKFGDMFASYGLAPRSSLPPAVMEQLIDEWIARTPSPASNSLQRKWKRGPAPRERIVDVARLTLETWDGPDESTAEGITVGHREIDSVLLKALLRSFPRRQLEISLVLPMRSDPHPQTLDALDGDGERVASVDLVPAASGWLTLADPAGLDQGSLLGGEVRLRREGHSQFMRRRPRRLVPMRFDDMLQSFVECERIQLGEDALVLARSEISPRVAQLLDVAARPGFTQHSHFPGLPSGWTLFADVQILSSIPSQQLEGQLVDLNLLQPVASSQVVLQGGLRLPGNIRKWSTWLPPELRVSSESSSPLAARIRSARATGSSTQPPALEKRGPPSVLIWDLVTAHLSDGDYEIEIFEDGKLADKPEVLRLRSANTPAITSDLGDPRPPLAHDQQIDTFGLFATRTSSPTSIRGVPAERTPLEVTARPPDNPPTWYHTRRTTQSSHPTATKVVIPGPGQHACIATGAHYMEIETVRRGQSTVQGVCKYCGLVKRYPTTARRKKTRKNKVTSKIAPHINVHELDEVKRSTPIDWRAAFDAVCHLGGGPTSALERVALGMEAGALFRDVFSRRLEVLAHIEIDRDPTTLVESSWEVVEPSIVGLANGRLVLGGFRSDRMMTAVENYVRRTRGRIIVDQHADAPPRIEIASLPDNQLEGLIDTIKRTTHKQVRYAPHAAEALAAQLPPLSRALATLPRVPVPGARSYERWDPMMACFEPTADAGTPGAFRLKGFTHTYIYRRPEDIGSMTALLGDARIVKYLAALETKQSLIGYDSLAQILYVPLGADLPGLYGRAATVASGYPPTENRAEQMLEYRLVPDALAGLLSDRLMH